LPLGCRNGLGSSGWILKAESLGKNSKLVAYEAKAETAGKKSEIYRTVNRSPTKNRTRLHGQ